jgi:TPR repeat protein
MQWGKSMRGVNLESRTRVFSLILCVVVGAISAARAFAQQPSNRGISLEGTKTNSSPDTHGAYYALVIGINNYQNLPKLDTPVSDAKSVKQVLEDRYGFQVRLLTDPSRYQILSALAEYRSKLHENDSLLVYYAGHGQYDAQALKAYWLPVDAERDDDANWIIADQITSSVRVLQARHVLVIADSCYGGMLTRSIGSTMKPLDPARYLEKMEAGKSRNLMSSGGNEPVADGGGSPGHSVFANALLQGLGGMEEKSFTAMDLFSTFVQRRVVGSSDQIPQYMPIPNSGDEEGDFVFFRSSLSSTLPPEPTPPPPPKPKEKGKEKEKEKQKDAPSASADDLSLAKQRIATGAYTAALPLFQKAAQHGSAEAMVHLGDYYNKAKNEFTGVPKDDSQAVNWYRKAAEAGSASGMGQLGYMYQGGYGVEEDQWQAMRWYRKGAEAGDTMAMRNLGGMYEHGIDIDLDFRQALSWYTKAAEVGDATAMLDLGRMYALGKGVQQDGAQASNWYGKALDSYRRAADGGDATAMMGLASMYLGGWGVEKDTAQALNWYRRAAETGDSKAAWILGERYARAKGSEKDLAQAANWYRKAAEAGNLEGLLLTARAYESGSGVEKDDAQAVIWYRKAAELGSLSAMVVLANKYQNGDGIKKDETQAQSWLRKLSQTAEAGGAGTMRGLANEYAHPFSAAKLKPDYAKAAEWYRKAAEAGNLFSMLSLGDMYQSGRGVEKDPAQAVGWYRRAANAGYTQAMIALGRAYRTGKGVGKDDDQALNWFRKAALRGDPGIMYNIGRVYETGAHDLRVRPSVEKDYQQAVSWYGKAATLGSVSAMVALGSDYERGFGVERDLAQAASWYQKAASAGDTNAASKLQGLGTGNTDSNPSPPRVQVATPVASGPNFSGTWVEINPHDSAHPRRLVLQQDGGQVMFAGFRLTLSQGIATWTGTQGCALQFQHAGYKYGGSDAAGTVTLKMSLQGNTLVYENGVRWTAPCDGHAIGNETNISKFQRGEIAEATPAQRPK